MKTEYVIELADNHDTWLYSGLYTKNGENATFETIQEAETTADKLFRQDPSLRYANIIRLDWTLVKKMSVGSIINR